MNFLIRLIVITVILGISVPGISKEKIPVFVSILPQKTFVQQIGMDRVDVTVMVQPGASPATYEPRPRQMAALSKARIYFSIGVPFEQAWLKKIRAANTKMSLVRTDQGIDKLSMAAHHHHDEDHHDDHHSDEKHHDEKYHDEPDHDEENHEGEIQDPHIWLSPKLVKIQARHIYQALVKEDPSHRDFYKKNYDQFLERLDSLDKKIREILVTKEKLRFMVFHPSWGYFAQTYGLEQIPIEVEGKDPKPAQLKELIEIAQKKKIKVVFTAPQFSDKSAKSVARQIKGKVIKIDPLAENWFENMTSVAQQFKEVLK